MQPMCQGGRCRSRAIPSIQLEAKASGNRSYAYKLVTYCAKVTGLHCLFLGPRRPGSGFGRFSQTR
jgi:hypothetical protein